MKQNRMLLIGLGILVLVIVYMGYEYINYNKYMSKKREQSDIVETKKEEKEEKTHEEDISDSFDTLPDIEKEETTDNQEKKEEGTTKENPVVVEPTTPTNPTTPTTPTKPSGPTEAEKINNDVNNFNYILGTQTFEPLYHFTGDTAFVETTKKIWELGSSNIKFRIIPGSQTVDLALSGGRNFKNVIIWYYANDLPFSASYTENYRQQDYNSLYNYAKELLTKYNNSGIDFYIGHWEGDWALLGSYDISIKTVNANTIQHMIDWLNIRQKAIDDAKRDVAHTNVNIYNYVEVNRVSDAIKGYDRVVNKVLPYTNVDMVSYSAWEIETLSSSQMKQYIDTIYANLKAKSGISGPRVFIGEYGLPLSSFSNEQERSNALLKETLNFSKQNVRFVLFWQMYNNELDPTTKKQRGFWLIDSSGNKVQLYNEFKSILASAKTYVRNYRTANGKVPSQDEYRLQLQKIINARIK